MTPAIPPVARRAYAILLRAYPRAFREDVGEEMAATFADRYRDQTARGRGALGALWARTLWDTARNATPERLAALALPRPSGGGGDMDRLGQDIRYALRALGQHRSFAIVAVLTIALGVGANTAIFSVVNAMLLQPLPYPAADRLVMVWTTTGSGNNAAAWPEYLDWRAQSRAFEEMGVWRGQSVTLTGGDAEPDRAFGAFVSASFFDVVGARARLGRTFRPEETDPTTAQPVAVISHGLWTRRFGADPGIVGRTLVLNGQPRTVVGVLGPEFEGGRAPFDGWFMGTEVWLPVADFPNANGLARGQTELLVAARLRPGTTVAAAQADLALVARRLEQAYPDTHAHRSVTIVPLHEQLVAGVRPALLLLLGAVGLVLLIASANVANLLLARASSRQRELALRSALGASRRRLLAQLLTESVVLALAAGALGAVIGSFALRGLVALVPADAGLPAALGIDRTVLAFTAGLSLMTGVMFGLVPALQASRPDLVAVLREGGRPVGGAARRRFRDGLVVAEIALSLVLLVGAGLLLRSVLALQGADPGFRTDRLLTMEFRLPTARYARPAQIAAFFRAILERMRAVPGVESVALVRAVPFSGNGGSSPYEIEGRAPAPPGRDPRTQTNIVSPGYFRTMGIPILQGRDIEERDTAEATPVAVVSATFARTAWPGQAPLGKRLRFKGVERWLTVVGIAGDVKHGSFVDAPAPQAYTPHEQDPRIFACVVARTAGDPMTAAASLRQAIWTVDPQQPVWKVRSMEALLAGARGPARALSILIALFAAVALLLAAVGIYGVMAYLVAQRTREIGIRMALGASARSVVLMVVGRGLALTLIATLLGIAGAAALTRTLATLLFGVGPLDPVTFVAAAVVLGGVALLACYLPARRAARVDPVVALAEE
ncbi:MAG TPA: ABC transporter permease [Vicinamibacteria bacterium]|nr:ABC transporter permease [Vicinamibacteria bacterium]